MKDEEIAYVAGVVDSIALLRVNVEKHEDTKTGLFAQPKIRISRNDSQVAALGMIDEYAMGVGVQAQAIEDVTSHRLEVVGPEDVKRFLEPIEPWLIQKHEQLDIFLNKIVPAFEDDQHLTKLGLIEIMGFADKMYELDPTIHDWKYSQGHLRQKWSGQL